MSVRAIDVGFDLRAQCMSVDLSDRPDLAEMPYDRKDGSEAVATGSRDQIAIELARAGYFVITARTPNGREVRCEPDNPEAFVVQPPHDNYWIGHASTTAALKWFDEQH